MKIIKISHGENFFSAQEYQQLLKNNLACVHKDTPPKGRSYDTQFEVFINASVGDIIYICNSNKTIDVIGFFSDNRPLYFNDKYKEDNWVCREFVPIYQAKNPDAYDKNNNKWWMPRNNSTCTEVGNSEFQVFEEEVLKPVFETSLEDLLKNRESLLENKSTGLSDIVQFQEHFSKCFRDENYLFESIHQLDNFELRKQEYDYSNRKKVEKQPVVKLRQVLIELLLKKNILNDEVIKSQKKLISTNFEKNVFHVWRSNFRILYPLIYDSVKPDVIQFFKNQIIQLQKDTGLIDETDYNLVHYDGAQNQGREDLWFAIYNKSHKNQKYAKQLFLTFGHEIMFGLLSRINPKINRLKVTERFDYTMILEEFQKYRDEIIADNTNLKQKIYKMINLLEYKKQIILQGPPGTGKTREAKLIAKEILGLDSIDELKENEQFKIIQFHPSYTYEDFVRGIIVTTDDGVAEYKTLNKILGDFARKANQSNLTGGVDDFERAWNQLVEDINEKKVTKIGTSNVEVEINSQGNIKFASPVATFEKTYELYKFGKTDLKYETYQKIVLNYLKNPEGLYKLQDYIAPQETQSDKPYVLVIDEINRANLSSVLGELIYALEYRGQTVESIYSTVEDGHSLVLPNNLYIIGTMNTADRSVGHIDYAIRRRFAFVEVLPKELKDDKIIFHQDLFRKVSELFIENYDEYLADDKVALKRVKTLSGEFRPEDVWIGHSYFIQKKLEDDKLEPEDFRMKIDYEIKPILLEYVKDGVLMGEVGEIAVEDYIKSL